MAPSAIRCDRLAERDSTRQKKKRTKKRKK
jgi:hypothetical protein